MNEVDAALELANAYRELREVGEFEASVLANAGVVAERLARFEAAAQQLEEATKVKKNRPAEADDFPYLAAPAPGYAPAPAGTIPFSGDPITLGTVTGTVTTAGTAPWVADPVEEYKKRKYEALSAAGLADKPSVSSALLPTKKDEMEAIKKLLMSPPSKSKSMLMKMLGRS